MANDSWDQVEFQKPDAEAGFDTPLVVHRHQGAPPAKIALVFVHGLGGQRYGTWGNFPAFLFAKYPQLDVMLYAYRTATKRFFTFESFDIKTQAKLLADELRERPFDGYILIGHSMGGLVCKGVVERLQAANADKTLGKILGLILLASPQLGTSRMPGFLARFNKDALALKLFNPYVNDVTDCFQNHVWTRTDQAPINSDAFPIPIFAVVSASDLWVDRMSAGYGLPDSQLLLLSGSHTAVVKPASTSDSAYRFVEKCVQACLDRFAAAPPPENETDQAMLAYKARILDLRGSFEARNPGGRERVCRDGPGLAELIDNLDDRRLSSKRRLFKYQYGGWLQLLMARCTDNRREAVAWARRGVEMLERSQALIEDYRKSHARGGNEEEKLAYEFLLEDDAHHRSRYLLAIGKAVLGKLGEGVSREEVREILDQVSEGYKRKYPPEEDQTLSWAFADDGEEKDKTTEGGKEK